MTLGAQTRPTKLAVFVWLCPGVSVLDSGLKVACAGALPFCYTPAHALFHLALQEDNRPLDNAPAVRYTCCIIRRSVAIEYGLPALAPVLPRAACCSHDTFA